MSQGRIGLQNFSLVIGKPVSARHNFVHVACAWLHLGPHMAGLYVVCVVLFVIMVMMT
jgi:hypothetical protein